MRSWRKQTVHKSGGTSVNALEKGTRSKEALEDFDSEHPGFRGAQDTFYVGNLKGVGRIYQQT